jgi:hypothetical protein
MSKRAWMGVVLGLALAVTPVAAQDKPEPAAVEWQAAIAGQILAFRNHDAPGALRLAAASFHETFSDPSEFFLQIIASGYAPIMESRSQTFGPYKLISPDKVLQELKILGKDQAIYEAIYVLSREKDGWRVSGVQLMKTAAVEV